METNGKKSDFELIMEAIDALPAPSCEREAIDAIPASSCVMKVADPMKCRVVGDREDFMTAIDKDNYRIGCALGDFIEDLDEDRRYFVSSAKADGNERIGSAMKAAFDDLSVHIDEIWKYLFCVIESDLDLSDFSDIMACMREFPEDMEMDWGIVQDETIPSGRVKVIIVAAGKYYENL